MKTKLIILFFFISGAAFGQFDLYLTAGAGIGNYLNKIERDKTQAGFELKSVFAGSFGADINWIRYSRINPFLGINFIFTGADQHHLSDVFPEYHFRFQYITVPIGLRVPIFKSLGFEASCVNSFQIANKTRNIDLPKTAAWDIGVQPAIYYQYKSWRGGLSYYFGFNDALGIGYLGELDFRYFNRIILFNLAYRLYSFD
ncbi:MAG: hypothetical protein FD155_31 [Bacteroidetes bacterium]|nr:MAG: hypothetical protein FD155_31 [Bacteroidota bacterium]